MRLLFLCPSAGYGGAERYAVTVASGARRRSIMVRAAVPYVDATRELVDAFHTGDVPTVDLRPAGPGPRARRLTAGTLRLARLIRRFRPDVVHITLPWPTAGFPELLTCALLRTPTVVVFQLVPDHPNLGRRVKLYRWARRRGQVWVAVSEHGRRVLADAVGAPVEALHHIYNGIAPNTQAPGVNALAVKRSLDLPAMSMVVLAVGRLEPQKGHADLLAAAFQLRKAHPDLRLLIAGEGPERERLEELIRCHELQDRVRLLGQVANVSQLMRAADFFVFPSHFEGTPFAMLEAMAQGVPVIAARFGGAEEVIDDGQSGLLVPVGDTQALALGIEWAIQHRSEMKARAREARRRVVEFSERTMIANTLELLGNVAEPCRQRAPSDL